MFPHIVGGSFEAGCYKARTDPDCDSIAIQTTVSEGYTALWERGRLDLTVEAMILENKQFHELFSAEELEICRKRLSQFEYKK